MTLLSAAEEVIIARRIERGDLQPKQRMIESNVRLVHSVARAYRGSPGSPVEERAPLSGLAETGERGHCAGAGSVCVF